jgi:hypothetical protein
MSKPTSPVFPTLKRAFALVIVVFLIHLYSSPAALLYAVQNPEKSICSKTIGYLQTKHYSVTLLSCSEGLTFTIHSQDGTMLAQDLLLGELVAGYPELAKTLSTGLAGNDARLMSFE